ncbi:MAG TPA: anaerobic ribonucleoside-triphosphate reductase activating protein, partial [Mobilitalea sp.]|nr:anaerobic ribonucleoside-triphosphate reductase activating protein [Mobilitalea sp.]
MDIKSSPEKYAFSSGNSAIPIDYIKESVSLILSGKTDYEFRTTIVSELHTPADMKSIGNWIRGAKAYYLQAYIDSGDVISPGFTSPDKETLYKYKEILSSYVEYVDIRGID